MMQSKIKSSSQYISESMTKWNKSIKTDETETVNYSDSETFTREYLRWSYILNITVTRVTIGDPAVT